MSVETTAAVWFLGYPLAAFLAGTAIGAVTRKPYTPYVLAGCAVAVVAVYLMVPPVPVSTAGLVTTVMFLLAPAFAFGLLVGLLAGRLRRKGDNGLPGADV